MKILLLILIISFSSTISSLEIVQTSRLTVVRPGEEAFIYCRANMEYDSCSWYPPSGRRCGPLSDSQRMCRIYDNIHYNGTSTNCQIMVKDVKSEQSGEWTCSLSKSNGEEMNSTVELTEALMAKLEWEDDLFGTFYLTSGDPKTVNCQALYSRPLGTFYYHFGEDYTQDNLPNDSQVISVTGEDNISNSSLSLTLNPTPEDNNKHLFCTYIQEDHKGDILFRQSISLELKVHYLMKSDNNLVLPPSESGENFNISLTFLALPRPQDSDVVWEVVVDEDTLTIPLDPESVKIEKNYVVYPLEQVSQFEYRARMTILNISKEENSKDHKLVISNSMVDTGEPLRVEQHFDIQVDQAQIAIEGSSLTTTIIVIVLMVIITIIVAAMTVVWAKNKRQLCFKNTSKPYNNPEDTDQKEPMVKHHPYGRPATVSKC